MRCCFEEDPQADITQIALWQAYQARFTEYVAQGRPLLPAAEFIKNVSVAFNNASAMVLPLPNGGQKFIIKGIKPRETPMSVKGQIYLGCKWLVSSTDPNIPVTKCQSQLATPQDLWVHILQDHLEPPEPGAGQKKKLFCRWGGCERFNPHGEDDRRKVIGHVRTHMPDADDIVPGKLKPEIPEDKQLKIVIKRNQTGTDDRGEAAGIPLTAALVLRNVARRGTGGGRELLLGEKALLFEVMAVNKPLAAYVADLLVDDDIMEED
jgi:chromatin structure-remodeling complex subunit RSC9